MLRLTLFIYLITCCGISYAQLTDLKVNGDGSVNVDPQKFSNTHATLEVTHAKDKDAEILFIITGSNDKEYVLELGESPIAQEPKAGQFKVTIDGTVQNHVLTIKKKDSPVQVINITLKQTASKSEDETSSLQFESPATTFQRVKGDKVYDKRTNMLLDENIIHIYVDQNGNFIGSGLPTVASPHNTYAFHVISDEPDLHFDLSVNGVFEEQFNIDDPKDSDANNENVTKGRPLQITPLDFGVEGPFTDEMTVTLARYNEDGSDRRNIIERTIKIAKLYHVSIATGLLATSLRHPTSIEVIPHPNGNADEFTLVADDPKARGIVSVMAIYYPKGRSFLLPPSGRFLGTDRMGIVVGAQLNDRLQENFLGGLSFDFARGGSIAFGAHFGRRNYISGYDRFDFGKDKFEGDLVVKKEWDLGIFIGVVIDTRVALKLLNLTDPE